MNENMWSLVWALKFPAIDKLVLANLAFFSVDDEGNICPSFMAATEKCGLSKQTVQRVLRRYEDEGLLIRNREHDSATKQPNEYRFDLQRMAEWPKVNVPPSRG